MAQIPNKLLNIKKLEEMNGFLKFLSFILNFFLKINKNFEADRNEKENNIKSS